MFVMLFIVLGTLQNLELSYINRYQKIKLVFLRDELSV